MAHPPSARSIPALRRRLLAWFDMERRPLPWRDVDDPYKVWVSEIMLQQTRVDTVWPYYERWIQRFPTVESLAQADIDDVLRLWSGLGYYTRARNLHKAAKCIVDEHGGQVPDNVETLQGLPGVGPYSAGAIASIAYQQAAPAVDGNALRVLSRLTGDREAIDQSATKKRLTQTATRLVDPERPGHWNQAVMELGATQCTPRDPECPRCPLERWCVAHRENIVNEIPRVKPRRSVQTQHVHFALVTENDRVLLVKRGDEGLLGGTWGLPGGTTDTPLGRFVREQTGLRVRKGKHLGQAEHRFTHKHWVMQVYDCRVQKNGARSTPGAQKARVHWLKPDELAHAPLAKATRKALALFETEA